MQPLRHHVRSGAWRKEPEGRLSIAFKALLRWSLWSCSVSGLLGVPFLNPGKQGYLFLWMAPLSGTCWTLSSDTEICAHPDSFRYFSSFFLLSNLPPLHPLLRNKKVTSYYAYFFLASFHVDSRYSFHQVASKSS